MQASTSVGGCVSAPARASGPPAPEALSLPADYRQHTTNLTLDSNRDDEGYWQDWRVDASWMYQHHVYRLAVRLITQRGLRSVLDVGCGSGEKLARHIAPLGVRVIGVDQASGIALARERLPDAELIVADLDDDAWASAIPIEPDIVICADVLEHLLDPRPALRAIARCAPRATVVLSTPERRRLRGRDCNRALKPEHVREWSRAEFIGFLGSQGYRVERSRLFPQDAAGVGRAVAQDVLWRAGFRSRSRLACHAVVCQTAA